MLFSSPEFLFIFLPLCLLAFHLTLWKAGGTAAGGVVVSGSGAADSTAQVSGYGDWLLYAGGAFLLLGLAWLAWTYRDEISIALKGPEKNGRAIK